VIGIRDLYPQRQNSRRPASGPSARSSALQSTCSSSRRLFKLLLEDFPACRRSVTVRTFESRSVLACPSQSSELHRTRRRRPCSSRVELTPGRPVAVLALWGQREPCVFNYGILPHDLYIIRRRVVSFAGGTLSVATGHSNPFLAKGGRIRGPPPDFFTNIPKLNVVFCRQPARLHVRARQHMF